MMRYGSICSGIEAATIAWRPLGWHCAFVSEIEAFPSAVLAERLPEIPNLGDFTRISPTDYSGSIDLLVGGTPCQAFSQAGLRKGLKDERGNLALEFARLAFRTHTRWVVWENVPGVLSSGRGCDFATFLSILVGWHVTAPAGGWRKAGLITGAPGHFNVGWRVLDAQYVRVQQFPRAIPQRRRRVILIGNRDSWTDCAKVLFDGEMCGGDLPPRRETRENASANAEGRTGQHVGIAKTDISGSSYASKLMCYENHGQDSRIRESGDVAPSILAQAGTGGNNLPLVQIVDEAVSIAENVIGRKDENGGNGVGAKEGVCYTLDTVGVHGVCYPIDIMNIDGRNDTFPAKCYGEPGASAYALTRRRPSGVCVSGVIRRLLPIECERLMGFPDNYTAIPWRGKSAEKCPDGHRYKALGNSMCVNVMAWIGERIDAVEKEKNDGR